MHRGSSKGPATDVAAPETLPLSASPNRRTLEVTIERAAGSRILNVEVPSSARVRDVLRLVGQPAEGSCALVDGASVPLDGPLPVGGRLTVVPTFSGG